MFSAFRSAHLCDLTPAADEIRDPVAGGRARALTVLHLEDSRVHQTLVAQHLRSMTDFAFTVLYAETEAEAAALFEPGKVGLVILDYYLKQGTSSGFLQQLRRADPLVPVVAVSQGSNAAIASELLRLGIDAFIRKQELTDQLLAQRIRETLARADAWRGTSRHPRTSATPRAQAWAAPYQPARA